MAHWEQWWLNGSSGGSSGALVAHWEQWLLIRSSGGSSRAVVAHWEQWWLIGSSGGSFGSMARITVLIFVVSVSLP